MSDATTDPQTSERIVAITLDESGMAPPTAEIEQERQVAIFDLIEMNLFALPNDDAPAGPYALRLAIRDRRLVVSITTQGGAPAGEFHLSLSPFRQIIKDYFSICESYYDAVKKLPPSQIEAIDMGRRGIHDEGSRILMERLEGKVRTDMATARRLFTLICVLHFTG
ncbi:MAG: hypothetical protein ACJA1L_002571 [Paracoccaceae bacterium]|jgi:uncharacterized protein (UPF0262 family)